MCVCVIRLRSEVSVCVMCMYIYMLHSCYVWKCAMYGNVHYVYTSHPCAVVCVHVMCLYFEVSVCVYV